MVNLRRLKPSSSTLQTALVVLAPILCSTGARADTILVTFINATFSANCVGGSGTCTEVVNGSVLFDDVAFTASDVSLTLTGTLSGSLDGFYNGSGTDPCTNNSPNCLEYPFFYDQNAVYPDNPIEFSPSFPPAFAFDSPTPEPLEGGAKNTLLFVGGLCGGDQPNCGATGAFPGGADYELTSGTFTSVDTSTSTPEPGSVILLVTGIAMLPGLVLVARYTAPMPPSPGLPAAR
jgi:hypothetical protein